jgi:hypothetical protein
MFQAPITPEIQTEVQNPIDEFNREYFGDAIFKTYRTVGYSVRFRNRFLYLDRDVHGSPFPICRLTWNGKMDNWDFAIYKYSDYRYAPDEWFFPDQEYVDGTVTGIMKAGMEAYPV